MSENLPAGERGRDPWISDLQTTGGRGVAFLPQRFCTDCRVGEVFFFLRFFFSNKRAPSAQPCILACLIQSLKK